MIVKRVGPLSFAKVSGVVYALMGLCFGAFFSLIGMAGAAASQRGYVPASSVIFGVGAIIVMPILYGGFGFVFSLIGAGLYNLVAGWVGGVEMDVQ